MRYIKILLCLLAVNIGASAQITTPSEYLGYELGEQFTRHHQVVGYFNKLASEVPTKMKIVEYGKTNEGRPLFTAIISSPENMQRLDEIRSNNLKRVGFEDGEASEMGIAIVWLSYNVHGDEAVSTEAALKTVHKFLDPSDTESAKWLEKTVVIMDPCLNPDGRARYVQFYGQFRQNPVNAHPEAFSHNQQWPGGRSNHYFFDLNRDWVWQTQIETRQRLKLYHEWMPHIHVDFHEQGYNSPYYFAPAAEPYHAVITDWQRSFQLEIGKNHAGYFDKNYWGYFAGEVFDLLYPSYGDTYPTFNGSIGMTYEQGGSAGGGTAVITEYGDTLTLADRIEHHFTTGFSTVEVAANRSEALEDEFGKYFKTPPTGPYKAYMISGRNDPAKISKLTELLDVHHISYGYRTSTKGLKGTSLSGGEVGDVSLNDGDLVIPVTQPKARLITALFEPETFVYDSVTYDLTAWNLPMAYGLTGATLTSIPSYEQAEQNKSVITSVSGNDYGYLLDYTSFAQGKALAYILKHGVQAGVAEGSFEMDGKNYPIGTVIILKGNNLNKDLGRILSAAQEEFSVSFTPVSTGLTPKGIDLGSNKVRKLRAPRIGLIAGPGTSSYNTGELWYFLEQELKYPMTMISTSVLNYVDLDKYDVLIVPNGGYSGFSSQMETVKEWVKKGGKVITIGNAIRQFADDEGSGITLVRDEEDTDDSSEFESVGTFGDRQREYASESIPGAIFEITLDNSHPLGYGYDKSYYTLKTSSFGPVRLTGGSVVAQMPETIIPVNGFAGSNALDKLGGSVVLGKARYGGGSVIVFTDNPVFRAFWENGKLLVVNALIMDR